jgi:ADP-heptose:LPS heptosyltransferase
MKILVMRMSSLGDLILSTSFLETLPDGVTVDWVVSSEFEFVLRGHPRIRKLWAYDKKTGLPGWFGLLRDLSREGYDARVDLHRTLRTGIARLWFFLEDLRLRRSVKTVAISKERLRTMLLLLLKGKAPPRFLPTPYWMRFARAANLVASSSNLPKKPSFLPILHGSGIPEEAILRERSLIPGAFYCLMPASRWKTKEWSPERFFDLARKLQGHGLKPVLLGREKDSACRRLKELFEAGNVPFLSALGEEDFRVSAILIKNASFFVGCDTGLSHLSESVGCRTLVIFGPTRPELGFGPCQDRSRAVFLPIGCAPCSKDGRHCHRVWSPYECMKELDSDAVEKAMVSW